MPTLKLEIPHNLSQEEALTRIKSLMTQLQSEQKEKLSGVKENWKREKGNIEFSVQGFHIAAAIHVKPHTIDIDAEVPFAVSLFKGKIKKVIEEGAKSALS